MRADLVAAFLGTRGRRDASSPPAFLDKRRAHASRRSFPLPTPLPSQVRAEQEPMQELRELYDEGSWGTLPLDVLLQKDCEP